MTIGCLQDQVSQYHAHAGVNFHAGGNIPHRCSYMLICNNKHLGVFTNPGLPHSIHVKLLSVTC